MEEYVEDIKEDEKSNHRSDESGKVEELNFLFQNS